MKDLTFEGRSAKALERIAKAAEDSANDLNRLTDYVVAISEALRTIKTRI